MTLKEVLSRNQWMWGKCYDFALALSERMPDADFVAIGNPDYPSHVGLMKDGKYYDCRGEMDKEQFLDHFKNESITAISRNVVELHAGVSGMKPPYKGNKDIQQARKAVKSVYS